VTVSSTKRTQLRSEAAVVAGCEVWKDQIAYLGSAGTPTAGPKPELCTPARVGPF
jgi:hypothetical protein